MFFLQSYSKVGFEVINTRIINHKFKPLLKDGCTNILVENRFFIRNYYGIKVVTNLCIKEEC